MNPDQIHPTPRIAVFLLFFILAFLPACATPSTIPSEPLSGNGQSIPDSTEKEQARDFALSIIKSLFTKDCDVLINALPEQVKVENADPQEKNEEMKRWVCSAVQQSVIGDHAFQEYLESYHTTVLDAQEYKTRILIDSPHKPPLSSREYMFYGYKPKQGKTDFMSDDLLVFKVRKTRDRWEVSSLGD